MSSFDTDSLDRPPSKKSRNGEIRALFSMGDFPNLLSQAQPPAFLERKIILDNFGSRESIRKVRNLASGIGVPVRRDRNIARGQRPNKDNFFTEHFQIILRRLPMFIAHEVLNYHRSMLNDTDRTTNYVEAITRTVKPGDVVVDIGTGTGIYALTAAKAGARRVYAIEVGPIARAALLAFRKNGLEDRIILLRNVSTRVRLPERADVIISELIGNEPFAEGVIRVTSDAISRMLKPGGRVIPSAIAVFGLPVMIPADELNTLTVTQQSVDLWKDRYGLDLSPLLRLAHQRLAQDGFADLKNPYEMRTWKYLCRPVLLAEREFAMAAPPPRVNVKRVITADTSGELNGMVVYFELKVGSTTLVSTQPAVVSNHNHWLSPVYVFPNARTVAEGASFRLTYWYRPWSGLSGCRMFTPQSSAPREKTTH